MKKINKKILIGLIVIFFLFIIVLGIFSYFRFDSSNHIKSGLFDEIYTGDKNIIEWTGNDFSFYSENSIDNIRIPILGTPSHIVYKLSIFDKNGNKLKYSVFGDNFEYGNDEIQGFLAIIFKDSIIGIKEYKIPKGAIKKLYDDTYEINLTDFHGYSDINGDTLRYKLFGKGKLDCVYLQIFHGIGEEIEFSILNNK